MKRILTTITVLLLTLLSSLCAGELKLAAMFSEHFDRKQRR
ncbi:MAG TPA: hypothetical protein PLF81_15865 [Candidatus Anammoximicrobium sp.]|nr:hypothetical protein [Candidatus Anammoximicrobium sp.]